MKKYDVDIPFIVWISVEGVDAESEEDAIEKTQDNVSLTAYGGRGEMVGVSGGQRVYASDEPAHYDNPEIKPSSSLSQ